MARKRPPLKSLQAFEAFARTGSYTMASRELNVTHSAVMQQVRSLETFLDIRLVDRGRRSVGVTQVGQSFAANLTRTFVAMDRAVDELLAENDRRPLIITTTPSFASEWLMPRLSQFQRQNPGINLEITPSFAVHPLDRYPIDVAIRYGTGGWKDGDSDLLMKSPFVVVVATKLIPNSRPITHSQLATLPWLQELGTREVEIWFEDLGIKLDKLPELIFLPGGMILPTMRQGGGVACTARILVEADINSGLVSILFSEGGERDEQGYHIVRPKGYRRATGNLFARWLQDQSNQASMPRPELLRDS